MPNPIPETVRLWLYLAGTAVLVVASGGVLPPEYLRLATTVAAVPLLEVPITTYTLD